MDPMDQNTNQSLGYWQNMPPYVPTPPTPPYFPSNFNYFMPPPNFWFPRPSDALVKSSEGVGLNVQQRSSVMQPNLICSTQRETDQEWVSNWCDKLKKPPPQLYCRSASKLTIPDVKAMLQEAVFILQELSRLKERLAETLSSGNTTMWNYRRQRILQAKERLEKITSQLYSKDLEIKRKLQKIKKKRTRNVRRCEELKKTKIEKNLHREELHKKLDVWLERLDEREKQILREREMNDEADKILSEVRKKQAESKKALELIQSLQKLRQLRKQASERKGLFTTRESDNTFSDKTSSLINMLESQLVDYQAEEKALKVMLDKAAEQNEERSLQQKLTAVQNETLKWLFGETEGPAHTDPLYSYWYFYTQAERNLDALLCIRHEWDSFLTNADTSEARSIPVQWVTPSGPSSDKWAQYISNILT